MVVSLYVCEIPRNINKEDLENLFSELEGYKDIRLKGTQDKRKIAFVDFESEKDGKFALETLNGFKFASEDRGLIIKISDNTKEGQGQKDKEKLTGRKRRSFSPDQKRYKEKNFREDKYDKYDKNNKYEKYERSTPTSINQNVPINQSVTPQPSNQNDLINFLNLLSNTNQGSNKPNHSNNLQNLPVPSNNAYNISEPTVDPLNNLIDVIQNIQTAQLLTSLANAGSTLTPSNQSNPNQSNQNQFESSKPTSSNSNSKFLSSFLNYEDQFRKMTDYRRNATNIVYVEGLPLNATEREVAHIFRPFPGYRSVRLINRDKNGEKTVICFVDFEDVIQSTICINTLQGYRFDKNDLLGLHFSYGVSKNNKK